MAVINHRMCFSSSLAFLAIATLLLAGNTAAIDVDLCKGSDFQVLCRLVTKGTTDPMVATELAIKALILNTNHVIGVTKRLEKSPELDVCKEELADVIDNLNGALNFLTNRDKGSLNSYLSAVVTDFVTCDDAYVESGKEPPLAKVAATAKEMASNCLALASQIH